jgi:hypothetical protein
MLGSVVVAFLGTPADPTSILLGLVFIAPFSLVAYGMGYAHAKAL